MEEVTGICRNCEKRPATHRWGGKNPEDALRRGAWVAWCEICVVEAQIEHIKDYAERLDALTTQLEALYEAETRSL